MCCALVVRRQALSSSALVGCLFGRFVVASCAAHGARQRRLGWRRCSWGWYAGKVRLVTPPKAGTSCLVCTCSACHVHGPGGTDRHTLPLLRPYQHASLSGSSIPSRRNSCRPTPASSMCWCRCVASESTASVPATSRHWRRAARLGPAAASDAALSCRGCLRYCCAFTPAWGRIQAVGRGSRTWRCSARAALQRGAASKRRHDWLLRPSYCAFLHFPPSTHEVPSAVGKFSPTVLCPAPAASLCYTGPACLQQRLVVRCQPCLDSSFPSQLRLICTFECTALLLQ